MEFMEFRMAADIADLTPESLPFNYNELKTWLEDNLMEYKNLIVTEETENDAKDIRARVNKVETAIKKQRISIKKAYLLPYEKFKSQCDELELVCKSAKENIDTQLKEIKKSRIDEKKAELKKHFSLVVGDMRKYITFEDTWEEWYGNKTTSLETAKENIKMKILDCENGIRAIRGLNSKFETELISDFSYHHNLHITLDRNNKLYEFERIEKEKTNGNEETEELETVDFRVYATKKQLSALKMFLKSAGIKYGKVPKE